MKKRIILGLILFVIAFTIPLVTLAKDDPPTLPAPPELKINIPGVGLAVLDANTSPVYIPWIAQYIIGVYKYAITFGAIFAVVMLIIGGVMYSMGGVAPSQITKGKEYIIGAITGLVILLSTYVILNAVNPNLTRMSALKIEVVQKVELPDSDVPTNSECGSIPDDPNKTGADMSLMATIDGGKFLQKPAAEKFKNWMAGIAKKPKVNSAFRSAEKQACLYKTEQKGVAGQACKGCSHECGLAIDLNVKTMSDTEYKALLTKAEANGWQNFWKWNASNLPTDWKDKLERWHFNYVGAGGVKDLCKFNTSCPQCKK